MPVLATLNVCGPTLFGHAGTALPTPELHSLLQLRAAALKAPADHGDVSALPSLLSPTNGKRPKPPGSNFKTLMLQFKEAKMLCQRVAVFQPRAPVRSGLLFLEASLRL